MLEFQCDPTSDTLRKELIDAAFSNAVGLDQDVNAISATRLSLALLYLVLTGDLPKSLAVARHDFFDPSAPPEFASGLFDVVLLNPPFVSLDTQDTEMRERVAVYLGPQGTGRVDLYLAFLKGSIKQLRPGGYGLFVLPHSFLLSKSARPVREWLVESCVVRCLADLSAVRVFGDTSIYVVLLIVQKKADDVCGDAAIVIKCQDQVGHALQDAIEGKRVDGKYYSIYDADQSAFRPDAWLVLAPTEATIEKRLSTLPPLKEFLDIKQGIVTGADDVFVVNSNAVPADGGPLFIPFLRDREMHAYQMPRRASQRVFSPFLDGVKIDEGTLRKDFPKTWAYLQKHKERLEQRGSLMRYHKKWWEPMWPRDPATLLRPKLVTPHLVIMPRFALDENGRYAVSHSPFLVSRDEAEQEQMLKLLLAVLNSSPCFWHIRTHSHVYRHGYTMLEPKTLAITPVPDITRWTSSEARQILDLVNKRTKADQDEWASLDARMDAIMSNAYGLTAQERRALGLEPANL